MDPVAELARRRERTTKQALADELGISPAFLGDILSGRRPISDRVLAAMGYERVVKFRKVRKNNGLRA